MPEEVFPQFYDFIKNSVLVAHNAKFDIGFLKSEFSRHRLSLNHHYICTLEMSRRHFPRLPNHKLGTVYRHLIGMNGDMFQIGDVMRKSDGSASCPRNRKQIHRALSDARMVAAIWLAMQGK